VREGGHAPRGLVDQIEAALLRGVVLSEGAKPPRLLRWSWKTLAASWSSFFRSPLWK
jgi:hypothetical protein